MNNNINKPFKTPILLLLYNRPDKVKILIDKLRRIKPSNIFISLDGPNPSKDYDSLKINHVKEEIKKIDWKCKIKKRFLKDNVGSGKAVSSAITWFLNKINEGIILEDDCIPNDSFFLFCKTLLKKYRKNNKIMMISGTNKLGEWKSDNKDYIFSRLGSCCGWATWKRAWKGYDFKLENFSTKKIEYTIDKSLSNSRYAKYLSKKIEKTKQELIDAWDYQWFFMIIKKRGLIISPTKNLIFNIGFDKEATNTKNPLSAISKIKTSLIKFPLRLENFIILDKEFDNKLINKETHILERALNYITAKIIWRK